MKLLLSFLLTLLSLYANELDSLLQEYQEHKQKSLKTVDERQGHLFVYSQKEFQLMQYTKLSDILKELPLTNLNKNKFGMYSLTLPATKADVSGFFRFFINDHEISSLQTQSASLSWGDLPLDFVDYIEVYYGDSSFSLGNETGVYFIRIYTKKASEQNGSQLTLSNSSTTSNSQSITHAQTFANGWSYYLFLNQTALQDERDFLNQGLNNDGVRRYAYLDLKHDTTAIQLGYSDIKKDNYISHSIDAHPNSGEIESKDFFIDFTHYFLKDESIKLQLGYDVNYLKHSEYNPSADGGLLLMPLVLKNPGPPKFYERFEESLKLSKLNVFLSKSFNYFDHNILVALSASQKKYEVKSREATSSGTTTSMEHYYDFDKEEVQSLILQDVYTLSSQLQLIGNAKFDYYKRSGILDNQSQEMYRMGAIYTPLENVGFKGFYTRTYLPPSFYNIDQTSVDKHNLEMQKYKYLTLEGVYTTQNSKFRLTYHDVKIDDFIYSAPNGFINVSDHTIETDGLIFNYEYLFTNDNQLHLSYYTTTVSENISNSNKGGYIKYMGSYEKFDYFTSLLYRNDYEYLGVDVRSSFDLSLGATYHLNKDVSVSFKGVNLLDKSTKSLHTTGFFINNLQNHALEDYGRSFNFTLRWAF
jgi:iron complex outermembrane receptor protein